MFLESDPTHLKRSSQVHFGIKTCRSFVELDWSRADGFHADLLHHKPLAPKGIPSRTSPNSLVWIYLPNRHVSYSETTTWGLMYVSQMKQTVSFLNLFRRKLIRLVVQELLRPRFPRFGKKYNLASPSSSFKSIWLQTAHSCYPCSSFGWIWQPWW